VSPVRLFAVADNREFISYGCRQRGAKRVCGMGNMLRVDARADVASPKMKHVEKIG